MLQELGLFLHPWIHPVYIFSHQENIHIQKNDKQA